MIRFLAIIVCLTLLYLSAAMVGKYDADISFTLWHYTITTSLVVMLALVLFLVSLLSLGFKVFWAIFSLPFVLFAKIMNFRKSSRYNYLFDAYRYLILSNYDAAKKSIKRLDDEVASKYVDHVNFIKSLSYSQSEEACYFAKLLPKQGEYKQFILSKIVPNMLLEEKYSQALKVMNDAGLSNSSDLAIRQNYLHIYSELALWKEFESKITKKDKQFSKEKVSSFYLKGAKYFLEEGGEDKAYNFLQESLILNPTSMESIEIFCSLNNARSMNQQNLPVLESAFVINPSFEIFELYAQSTTLPAEEVYEKFTSLVDIQKYRDVLLSIAAYLKLFDKVDSLLSCRI